MFMLLFNHEKFGISRLVGLWKIAYAKGVY